MYTLEETAARVTAAAMAAHGAHRVRPVTKESYRVREDLHNALGRAGARDPATCELLAQVAGWELVEGWDPARVLVTSHPSLRGFFYVLPTSNQEDLASYIYS